MQLLYLQTTSPTISPHTQKSRSQLEPIYSTAEPRSGPDYPFKVRILSRLEATCLSLEVITARVCYKLWQVGAVHALYTV